jgi:hypothetical protein
MLDDFDVDVAVLLIVAVVIVLGVLCERGEEK